MNIIVTVTHATHAPKSDTVVFSWHEKARVGGTCSIVSVPKLDLRRQQKKKKSAIISPARHTPSNQSIRTSRVGPNQYICIKPLATETRVSALMCIVYCPFACIRDDPNSNPKQLSFTRLIGKYMYTCVHVSKDTCIDVDSGQWCTFDQREEALRPVKA